MDSKFSESIKIVPTETGKRQRCVKISMESDSYPIKNYEINGSIRIGKNLRKSSINRQDDMPESLLTCLDEMQTNGKVIAWKAKGQGNKLSVKVTWNKKHKNRKTSATKVGGEFVM
jgi:hypothetical protein